tara:strand:- start:1949 stop:2524 length:576 start_codon:yes stop_codon:yes gene_type:complete
MTTDNVIAEAAANAIAESAASGALDKVIVNNDEYSIQYSGSTNDGQDADELVSVWSLLDGTESRVLKHKLNEVLRKRTRSNQQVFWIPGMPGQPPKVDKGSELLCLLHPDNDEREWLNNIGLVAQTCRKSNLRSDFDLQNHMLHRHQQEWSLIETAREQEARQAQDELVRLQIEAMSGVAKTDTSPPRKKR